MSDLYLSLSLMVILCGLASLAGAGFAVRSTQAARLLIEVSAGTLIFLYMGCLWDRPLLTQWLPWSSAIILGNWLPIIACFLVGVCLRTSSIRIWRKTLLTVTTFAFAGYSLASPLLGEPPKCLFTSSGQSLLVQSCEETCSPASAATLLRLHGISASEGEMARLCLTRSGTHWLGVYRGLKLKTKGTGWDVVAEDFVPRLKQPLEEFRPGVLSLAFSARPGSQLVASGFRNGAGHSVVLLEQTGSGQLCVFDPSPEFGFETWGETFLGDIRTAVLLRLVPRDPQVASQDEVRHRVRKQRFERGLAFLQP